MDSRIVAALARAFLITKPKPPMNPAEWASEYLYVPHGESRYPGKFSTTLMPYQWEMLAVVGEKGVGRFTYMLASQCAKTQTMLALALYYTHWLPSSVGLYFSNIAHLEEFSKDRLQATIECSPALKPLVKKNTTKNSGNTIRHKRSSNGAIIRLKNANVGSSFRGPSMRLVGMDEVDNLQYDVQGEGDPIQQGLSRGTVWGDLFKFVVASTPTITGASLTDASFQDSDQRHYYVPCPHCQHMQVLEMSTAVDGELHYWFKIPKDQPADAYFECRACHQAITHQHKTWMLAHGQWRKHNPAVANHAGFTLSTFYSPLFSWERMASEWLDAQRKGPMALKAFVNTRLAQTWSDYDTTKLNTNALAAKRETYSAFIPAPVAYLTAFADIQKDRIEVSLYGHGLDEHVWLIRHYVIFGATTSSLTPAFKTLDVLLASEFEHESGSMLKVLCAFVDGGEGAKQGVVYEFTHALSRRKRAVFASKGASTFVKGLVKKSVDAKKDVHIQMDSNQLKDALIPRLGISDKRDPGYIHLPEARIVYLLQEGMELQEFWNPDGTSYDAQFLDQFLAEYKKGGRWAKKPGHNRNEALDCLVGACGAFLFAKRERWAKVNVTAQLQFLNGGIKPELPVLVPTPTPEPIVPWPAQPVPVALPKPKPVASPPPRPARVDLNDLIGSYDSC